MCHPVDEFRQSKAVPFSSVHDNERLLKGCRGGSEDALATSTCVKDGTC